MSFGVESGIQKREKGNPLSFQVVYRLSLSSEVKRDELDRSIMRRNPNCLRSTPILRRSSLPICGTLLSLLLLPPLIS